MDTNRRSLEATEKGRELRQSWQHIGGDLAHPTKSNASGTADDMGDSNDAEQSESPNLRGSTETENAGLSKNGLQLLREAGPPQLRESNENNEFGRHTRTLGADLDLLVADYET